MEERETHIIDLENKVLGRAAVEIAKLLRGKQKPDFEHYKDMGDFVVVKNLKKVRLSGRKVTEKKYYRHSGYIGGLKVENFARVFGRYPERVLQLAVLGMMPKNKLSKQQIKRLKVEEESNK